MKCRSVACIWSGSPPAHKVTATAVLDQPPTLYTGGCDGSIIWWNLSSSSASSSNPEIKPIAMLCGHASPIVDLVICYPLMVPREVKTNNSSNVGGKSSPDNCGALLSACTNGVLCVWSRGSGHCRRRRKLPPWVGSPSNVCTLPSNERYVCIACSFTDAAHLPDHHSTDSVEGFEVSVDKEAQPRKHPKCTLVIVDTYTLTIVQTIFHDNLSIGPLKSMAVVLMGDEKEKHYVLLANTFGGLQLVSILKDSLENGGSVSHSHKSSSQSEITILGDVLIEGEQMVSIASSSNIIALVLKNRCVFRLLGSGNTIGEISFANSSLCLEGDCTRLCIIGAIFLNCGDAALDSNKADKRLSENFAAWNNRGFAIVYNISYMNDTFECEPLYEIPDSSHSPDGRISFSFIQLSRYLLRIESVCIHAEEPSQWIPSVTIWSLPQKHEDGQPNQCCKLLGEGNCFAESYGFKKSCILNNMHEDGKTNGFRHMGKIVSSSMVISENLFAPCAVVYGFSSGEIEVVRFNSFQGLDSQGGSAHLAVYSHIPRQYFSGHTGPVLCLAAHQMVCTPQGWSFNQVLVSGSMDCTVRIWDLDTGNLIRVMHQHTSPVRQIILPPVHTERPWSDCFLSVGEDACVALASLETLRVERMFPGHPNYPARVVWDGARGYVACLCHNHLKVSDASDVLYVWDVKTGARERVLRGTASHSLFDHFCKGISMNSISGTVLNGNTSVSSLLLPVTDDGSFFQSRSNNLGKEASSLVSANMSSVTEPSTSKCYVDKGNTGKVSSSTPFVLHREKHFIGGSCPFPGIAALRFDLASLMFPSHMRGSMAKETYRPMNSNMKEHGAETLSPHHITTEDGSDMMETILTDTMEKHDWISSLEEHLLRFSLSFLHLWNVDFELDKLLITDMKLERPDNFIVASGLEGDRRSLTLAFPGLSANLELWRSSSEFCAMRSLTMVSLAQRMISLSQSGSTASRALAAFYTRSFADKFPDIKPPSLQLLVGFWQDESEHVRMAARSLFHCAASRAIPLPLCGQKENDSKFVRSLSGIEDNRSGGISRGTSTNAYGSDSLETQTTSETEESKILEWLESFEVQDWTSCVGGTGQDAMTSHIIVAAALAIWYPSLVKPSLAMLVVHPLTKLVMAMNEKYSSTAAELLAEGMESTWKACIGSEISRLIGDIFFQVECVSGSSANSSGQRAAIPASIREILVGILLPSLAMADLLGFLTVVESQIWSTASDSPVHLVSLMTLIRVVRGSPRNLAQCLDKVVYFILQTMDPGNSVMRKTCLQSSMAALKEVVRVFPMVALNEASTRLAVGDAIGEINNASIRVYDMQSVAKIKVLDASGPPGLPSLLAGTSEAVLITTISALSFSPDGEGLVAFSEHGLMIRWWSLGSVWWEKLSRNFVPVQCTKLIFVPPWEGFSPNSSRTSVMASILGQDRGANVQENAGGSSSPDSLKLLIHNLDLSYRLEWVGDRKIMLMRHGIDLGTFQL